MTVITKDYNEKMSSLCVNMHEVLRYLNGNEDNETLEIINSSLDELGSDFSYRVCYSVFPVCVENDRVVFPFKSVKSKDLAKCLKDCKSAVIFASTIGFGIDRMIKKHSLISPLKSVVFQAIGAERIECLCDTFCEDIKKEYGNITPRFSAGYGDLELSFQKDIFKVLQCSKNIGVSLNGNLLMSPTKSVTAIIGVKQ